jgi:hypothetical protein
MQNSAAKVCCSSISQLAQRKRTGRRQQSHRQTQAVKHPEALGTNTSSHRQGTSTRQRYKYHNAGLVYACNTAVFKSACVFVKGAWFGSAHLRLTHPKPCRWHSYKQFTTLKTHPGHLKAQCALATHTGAEGVGNAAFASPECTRTAQHASLYYRPRSPIQTHTVVPTQLHYTHHNQLHALGLAVKRPTHLAPHTCVKGISATWLLPCASPQPPPAPDPPPPSIMPAEPCGAGR